MTRSRDEAPDALRVLREVWSAQGQTSADIGEHGGHGKSCRRMAGVGVGKTEVAKVLASVLGRKLIRLQCYEGIDTNQALYEWDYARQMLHIRALSERQITDEHAVDQVFGPKFLVERPLLEAVRSGA